MNTSEPREETNPSKGTDEPWKEPGQKSQDPAQPEPETLTSKSGNVQTRITIIVGTARYSITPVGKHWSVLHDGKVEGDFEKKEAAFEAAVAAGSLALRQGHELQIVAPSSAAGAGTANGVS